jgi:hypothetical protein
MGERISLYAAARNRSHVDVLFEGVKTSAIEILRLLPPAADSLRMTVKVAPVVILSQVKNLIA